MSSRKPEEKYLQIQYFPAKRRAHFERENNCIPLYNSSIYMLETLTSIRHNNQQDVSFKNKYARVLPCLSENIIVVY